VLTENGHGNSTLRSPNIGASKGLYPKGPARQSQTHLFMISGKLVGLSPQIHRPARMVGDPDISAEAPVIRLEVRKSLRSEQMYRPTRWEKGGSADGCPGPQRGRYRRKNRSQLPWKMPSIASVE
jgi:hypothetical protein